MLDEALRDPSLLESAAWHTFCEAEKAAERGDVDTARAGWERLFRSPERHPWVDYGLVAESIAHEYVRRKQWDAAIEWLEHDLAIVRAESSGSGEWVCRRDIADVLLRAGRREEATRIYEENRVAAPDDIWLYNSAALGWLYSAHDPAEALPWIDEALAIVNRTGDPEGLNDQLQRLHMEAVQATPTLGFGDQVVPLGDG
jgi:tetratricopeptide (TPR) repeat protein